MLQHGQTFNLFPFDNQRFKMQFESFKLKQKDLVYNWKHVAINPSIDFHDFTLLGHRNSTSTDANYTSAVVEISLVRKAGYYYSILFTPLLVVSLLCLSAGWSPPHQRLAVLLTSNIFLLTYKIWFRATQLPPTGGSVLAVDYIDICWTVCLLSLLSHSLVQWCGGGGGRGPTTTTIPRHQEAFSLDHNPDGSQSQLINPGCMIWGSFYSQSQVETVLVQWTLPLLFLVCQAGFWCRVAAISQDTEGLVPLTGQ